MDDKQVVLNAIIKVFQSQKNILDMMDEVNPAMLNMDEKLFSEIMFSLQKDGVISGVMFENDNPQKITLWDTIRVNTANFKVK